VSDTSYLDLPEFAQRQAKLARQRRMAQALLERGTTPIEVRSGSISNWQGANQIFQAFMGARALREADKEEGRLAKDQQSKFQELVDALMRKNKGSPPGATPPFVPPGVAQGVSRNVPRETLPPSPAQTFAAPGLAPDADPQGEPIFAPPMSEAQTFGYQNQAPTVTDAGGVSPLPGREPTLSDDFEQEKQLQQVMADRERNEAAAMQQQAGIEDQSFLSARDRIAQALAAQPQQSAPMPPEPQALAAPIPPMPPHMQPQAAPQSPAAVLPPAPPPAPAEAPVGAPQGPDEAQLRALINFAQATGNRELMNYAMQQVVPKAPSAQEAFTLGEGQVRYDSRGRVVARGPDKPQKPDEAMEEVRKFGAMLDAAGIVDPAQRQQMYADYAKRKGSGVSVNVGERAPQGYRWKEDGSLEPIPGGPATKTPEAQQKQAVGVKNLRNAIAEYRKELAGFGGLDYVSPDQRSAIQSKYQNMLLQAKEAYNLGVLNGPDFQILQEVITDPTSFKGIITSRGALDKQASELDRIMGGVGQVVEQAPVHGGENASQQAQAASAPKSVTHQGKQYEYIGTDKGRPVYKAKDGSRIIGK
jgi:hypothetical protein